MTNYQDSWTKCDIENLSKALTFAYKIQTTYKEPLELRDRVMGWTFILEDDFYMDEVLAAIRIYMKKNRDMPVPADIANIISPEPPKITQAEYIAAVKWKEVNGHKPFSRQQGVIEQFENQEKESRECQNLEVSLQVKQILQGTLTKQ